MRKLTDFVSHIRMEDRLMGPSRMIRYSCVLAALVAMLLPPGNANATHYPATANCYDCHTVSKSKMVPNTHLLRKSQRTVALGMSAADPDVRCLFCHDDAAAPNVSQTQPGDVMKAVSEHFGSSYRSKHRANSQSSFFNNDGSTLHCLDCHAGITQGVESDLAGNANIHGKDASAQVLDVYSTLVSDTTAPANAAEVSGKTCSFSGCHGTGNNYEDFGNRRAYKQHGYSNLTDNDGAAIDECTDCHGPHGSKFGVKNLVLLNTSGANGEAATGLPVQLNECDVCHTNDENDGLTDNFMEYGHGKVGIMCDSCHSTSHVNSSNPDYHYFEAAPRLKANLAENTSVTSTFGTYFFSNCQKCHGGHNTHEIAGEARMAGCRDCHDQHGKLAADSVYANDTMIRRSIAGEATRLADDDIKYNGGWYVDGATYGVCDNDACHTTIPAGQSLGSPEVHGPAAPNNIVLTATTCSGGVGCHGKHNQTPFGVAYDCVDCHASSGLDHTGTNENAAMHQQHLDSTYILTDCKLCHPHSGPGTVGEGVHNNGVVNFGGSRLTLASYDPAASNIGINCSAGNGCHDSDDNEWAAGDLGADKCVDCHAAWPKLLAQWAGGTFPPISNKHVNHLDSAAFPQASYDLKCYVCHADSIDSTGGFVVGGKHLNGGMPGEFKFDAAYAGYQGLTPAKTGSWGTAVCSNVKCHNGVATPTWAGASVIACGDCHNTGKGTASKGPLPSQASIAGSHAAHADNNNIYADCAKCHPNAESYTAQGGHGDHQNLAVEIVPSGGVYADADGKGGVVFSGDGNDDGTCSATSCHGAGIPTWGNASSVSCGSCHGDVARVTTGYTDPSDAPKGAPPVDTDNPADATNDRYTTGKHLYHLNESFAKTGTSCNLCHNGAGSGSGLHADGVVQISLHSAAGGSATFTDGGTPTTTGTCANLACHQNADWDANFNGGCDFCHGYPPTDASNPANNRHAQGTTPVPHNTPVGISNFKFYHDNCTVCHGTSDNGSGQHSPAAGYDPLVNHRNGKITMSGDLGYDEGAFGCLGACHNDNTIHRLSDSGLTVEYINGLLPSCERCHGNTNGPAPQVVWPSGNASNKTTAYGSHLDGGTNGWNAVCNRCHTGHRGSITVPLPSTSWTNRSPVDGNQDLVNVNMQTRLGIDYQADNGMHGGIRLGGTDTTITEEGLASRPAANEAETCWGCHGSNTAINEWGANVDTNGSFPTNGWSGTTYNYGDMFETNTWTNATSAWIDSSNQGNYRRDAYQHDSSNGYVLSRRIASVHSVDLSVASNPGSSVANNVDASGNVRHATNGHILEARNQIRCSYCHDVHDMNRALNDSSWGRPHLRGTWVGNPYGPDVPPINSYNYPTTGGGKGYGNRKSNSNGSDVFPTNNAVPRMYPSSSTGIGGYFIDQNSGWPTVPGTGNDTLADTAGICTLCHGTDVDNMDYWTGSKLWRTGQINGHANATIGGTGTLGGNAANIFDARRGSGTIVYMSTQDRVGSTSNRWGENQLPDNSGPHRSIFRQGSSNSWNTGWYGGTEGASTRGSQYSTWYSATGIGNDADTRHTDGQRAHNFTCSKCHSPHATGLPALLITNCLDRQAGRWSRSGQGPQSTNAMVLRTMNNCHRKDNTSTGWHKLNTAQ